MLTFDQRVKNYLQQTGRHDLTPRQERRLHKKDWHQSNEAVHRRATKSVLLALARQKRAERRLFLA